MTAYTYRSMASSSACARRAASNGDHFVYLEPHAIELFLEFVEQQKKRFARGAA
jgi:hypothetical protein